jgi:hypothetical protein
MSADRDAVLTMADADTLCHHSALKQALSGLFYEAIGAINLDA